MNHPNACPTCRAPIQPGAIRCAYCGTPTPLAEVHAVHQQRMAEHQARVEADNRARRHFANIATAKSAANTGLALAIIGLPICCAPMSIVGGVLGMRALQLAKAEQIEAPVRAFISMVVAGLSTILTISVIIFAIIDSRDHAQRLEVVKARLAGKREAQVIDANVACDLGEERLLEEGYNGDKSIGDVTCEGPLDLAADRGSMKNIRATINSKRMVLTACLSHGSRWFVVKLTDGADCNAAAVPSQKTTGSAPSGGSEGRTDEKKAKPPASRSVQ